MNGSCGEELTPLIEGITLININLKMLSDTLRSSFVLASCSKIRPIFVAFEDVACTDSHEAFVLTSTIPFLLSFVGSSFV